MKEILKFFFPEMDKYQRFWFHPSSEHDVMVYNKYSSMFEKIEEITEDMTDEYVVGEIILLDQLARQCYRVSEDMKSKQSKYDAMALKRTMILIERGFYETDSPIYYQIFSLMPLRHTKNVENIKLCLKIAEGIDSKSKNLRRFLKRTKESLKKLDS